MRERIVQKIGLPAAVKKNSTQIEANKSVEQIGEGRIQATTHYYH